MTRPGAVPALASTLEGNAADRESQQLRIAAVQALGLIGTAEARSALETHAKANLPPAERAAVEAALRLPARCSPAPSARERRLAPPGEARQGTGVAAWRATPPSAPQTEAA